MRSWAAAWLGLGLWAATPAAASLMVTYQFNGTGNWSIDAVGGDQTPVGTLSAAVPAGSTVEQAYLYSSRWSLLGPVTAPEVNLDGTVYAPGDFTPLGQFNPDPGNPDFFLGAYRVDVTAQMQSAIGGGGGLFNFLVEAEDSNFETDGEVLAVVYSNPSELERTIAFLDGFTSSTGDQFTLQLDEALDTSQAGFEALLSLGIGFSAQLAGPQFSEVFVNGRRLTASAGGEDDAVGSFPPVNGQLITAGGLGDDPSNPADPDANPDGDPRSDDELYNLALGNETNSTPYVEDGLTEILIRTFNPSLDDNIFFTGLNITADGDVVPEAPLSVLLIVAVAVLLRRRSASASRSRARTTPTA